MTSFAPLLRRIALSVPLTVGLCLTYTGALAHEFWIEPREFQVSPDEPVEADLKNGQEFKGVNLSWFDKRIDRMDMARGSDVTPILGRAGDIPAIALPPQDEGLLTLIYTSTPTILTYDDWETVMVFVEHKDFPWFVERHDARGLPHEDVREVYRRYCKSLIAVGAGAGADDDTGMPLEFIAQANPYTDDMSEGLPVLLLYNRSPVADGQVEVFDRAPDGTVEITRLRTDDKGYATIPVTPGHDYMLDHVVLREPPAWIAARDGVMWESLWANLTFRVPD